MESYHRRKDLIHLIAEHTYQTTEAIKGLSEEYGFVPHSQNRDTLFIPPIWDGQFLPKSFIIEDDGMPGAGKSTLLDKFLTDDHGLPFIFMTSETSEVAKDLSRYPAFVTLLNQFPNADLDDLTFVAEQMKDVLPTSQEAADDRLYREIFKWVGSNEAIEHAEEMEKGKLVPSPIIWQRGVIDRIIFARALLVSGKFNRIPPSFMIDIDPYMSSVERFTELHRGRRYGVMLHLVSPEIALSRKEHSGIINLAFLDTLYAQYLRFYYEYLSKFPNTTIALAVVHSDEGTVAENYTRFSAKMFSLISQSRIDSAANDFLNQNRGYPGNPPHGWKWDDVL